MAVEPLERQRVAADRLDRVELLLHVLAVDETNFARAPLAPGARAIPAQDGVRVHAAMTVGPVDLGRPRASRGSHGKGFVTWVFAHWALLRARSIAARARPSPCSPATAPARDTAFLPMICPARNAARHTAASRHAVEPGTARAATSVASDPAMNASPAPVASTHRARSAGTCTAPCSPMALAIPDPRVPSHDAPLA